MAQVNTKTVGLTSGENGHQHLLLRFCVNAESLLLSSRTVKIIDNESLYFVRILTDYGTDLSKVQALNGAVYYGAFQDHAQDTVKSGLCAVKIGCHKHDSKVTDQKGASDLKACVFVQDHSHNIGTACRGTYIKYHSSTNCGENNGKAQLQKYIMSQWCL